MQARKHCDRNVETQLRRYQFDLELRDLATVQASDLDRKRDARCGMASVSRRLESI